MKKIYILIITIHFVFVSENICQTYLFNGNKSGFSAMVGVFSVRSYTRQNAAFFGAEATISGYLSFGFSRTFSKYDYDNGFNTYSLNLALYKSEKVNRVWTYPLVASYSKVNNKDVFLGGGGVALKNQISPKTSITPVFLVLFQNQSRYSGKKYSRVFGFELNVVHQKLRIVPSITLAQGNTAIAIGGGFIL